MWEWIVEYGPGMLKGGALVAILFFVYVINEQLEEIRRGTRAIVQLLDQLNDRDRVRR